MPFQIVKEFSFSAAHQLEGLAPTHPCSRVHGHNYKVQLVLSAPGLDEIGFVRDYRDLDRFKKYLDEVYDHKYLGAQELDTGPHGEMIPRVLSGWNPTAENMAAHFYRTAAEWFPELTAVGVSETDKTWAWFTPGDNNVQLAE